LRRRRNRLNIDVTNLTPHQGQTMPNCLPIALGRAAVLVLATLGIAQTVYFRQLRSNPLRGFLRAPLGLFVGRLR
jgi:hypothetical protein